MTTLPPSDAKARLSGIAGEVARTHGRVHVTRNGRDYVVLLAAEDLESIEATLEPLADPEAQRRLRESEADVEAGRDCRWAGQRAGMAVFAVTMVNGPAWDPAVRRREQAGWDEHATFMDGLLAEGRVILGGPIGDGTDVLLVVEAATLADDPWMDRIPRIGRVQPWQLWLDPRAQARGQERTAVPSEQAANAFGAPRS